MLCISLFNIAIALVVCLVLCFIGLTVAWWNPKWIADNDETRCPGPGLSPVRFPEQNYTIRKNEHPSKQIPALIELTDMGHTMTTCWRFSRRDRLKILFGGVMWSSVWVYGEDRTRPYFSTDKSDIWPVPKRSSKAR